MTTTEDQLCLVDAVLDMEDWDLLKHTLETVSGGGANAFVQAAAIGHCRAFDVLCLMEPEAVDAILGDCWVAAEQHNQVDFLRHLIDVKPANTSVVIGASFHGITTNDPSWIDAVLPHVWNPHPTVSFVILEHALRKKGLNARVVRRLTDPRLQLFEHPQVTAQALVRTSNVQHSAENMDLLLRTKHRRQVLY